MRRVAGGWSGTGREWVYDADRYARVAEARRAEQEAMVAYTTTAGCRMAFLRADLDDPLLAPGWRCGRCDACGSLELPSRPSTELVTRARRQLDRPGIELAPRLQWPSGMDRLGIDLKGRIPAEHRPEPGRAVTRLDALGWASAVRTLLASGAADRPLPEELRAPVLQVLDDWRPDVHGVVVISSVTRPALVEHLAHGAARRLGVRLVGRIVPDPARPPGRRDVSSARRLAHVAARLGLDLGPALVGLPGRRVLLVDDLTDSGWTLTVAARLLRQAGADAVLPFVLARL